MRAPAPDWRAAIDAVLRTEDQPRLVFQPIVDLRRGVVAGYEALARFAGPPDAPPDVWFDAADRLGLGVRLESRVLRAAVAARDSLPPDCFLTVNVSPHLLAERELAGLLTGVLDLSRIVLELTEHVEIRDHQQLAGVLAEVRRAGGVVALDDAGSGYAGLRQLALIRPEMVKMDRALVDHLDGDEVKLALAELLGRYADRLDAVVIAEGVERPEELAALARLGVPLAQGWLFGRPGPRWPTLPSALAEAVRALSARREHVDRIAGLAEATAVVSDDDALAATALFRADPGLEHVVVLDRYGRAVRVLRRRLRADDDPVAVQQLPVSLRVTVDADVAEVAFRAMTRPPATRFDPIVCGDTYGRYAGLVRPERLMVRLAELKRVPGPADDSLGDRTQVLALGAVDGGGP